MNQEDELNDLAVFTFGLEDRGNADGAVAQNAGDLGDHPRSIGDAEAEVIFRNDLVDGQTSSIKMVGNEAVIASGRKERGGGIGEVGDDRTGGGILASAPPIKKGFTDDISMNGEGVERDYAASMLWARRAADQGDASGECYVGVLYNTDERAARVTIPLLEAEGLCVGDQQPYSGKLLNATMNRHCEEDGRPYLGVEIRQDQIADEPGQQLWAERLLEICGQVALKLDE